MKGTALLVLLVLTPLLAGCGGAEVTSTSTSAKVSAEVADALFGKMLVSLQEANKILETYDKAKIKEAILSYQVIAKEVNSMELSPAVGEKARKKYQLPIADEIGKFKSTLMQAAATRKMKQEDLAEIARMFQRASQ